MVSTPFKFSMEYSAVAVSFLFSKSTSAVQFKCFTTASSGFEKLWWSQWICHLKWQTWYIFTLTLITLIILMYAIWCHLVAWCDGPTLVRNICLVTDYLVILIVKMRQLSQYDLVQYTYPTSFWYQNIIVPRYPARYLLGTCLAEFSTEYRF